jgi:hypothetical protein
VFSCISSVDILFVTFLYFDINLFGRQLIDFAHLVLAMILYNLSFVPL